MKLTDLAPKATLKRTAKVYESYFNENISFLEKASNSMAKEMLSRVRALIQEQRNSTSFHSSEQDPNYLKLVFMEQALIAKIRESVPTAMGGTSTGATGTSGTATGATTDPVKAQAAQQAAVNRIRDPRLKAAMQKSVKGQGLTKDEQSLVANAALASGGIAEDGYDADQLTPDMKTAYVNADITTNEGRRLNESEVQQAQVVLASQDMVDKVQKMLEEVTAMQYKDLPALTDQIKNQIGVQQAGQFNTDATSALAGLVENLQGAKQQLEQALSVVTGQEQVIPGQDQDLGMGGEMPDEEVAELPPLGEPEEEEEPAMPGGTAELGRGRR